MKYSLWVGGTEVTDILLSLEEVEKLAWQYESDGYEDIHIMPYEEDHEN